MEDESRWEQEQEDIEEQEEATTNGSNDDSNGNDGAYDDEPPIVEFEDPVYKLSQSYELEPEYENLPQEQEVQGSNVNTERTSWIPRAN